MIHQFYRTFVTIIQWGFPSPIYTHTQLQWGCPIPM